MAISILLYQRCCLPVRVQHSSAELHQPPVSLSRRSTRTAMGNQWDHSPHAPRHRLPRVTHVAGGDGHPGRTKGSSAQTRRRHCTTSAAAADAVKSRK